MVVVEKRFKNSNDNFGLDTIYADGCARVAKKGKKIILNI